MTIEEKHIKILSDVPMLKLSLSVMNTSLLRDYRENTQGMITLSRQIIKDMESEPEDVRDFILSMCLNEDGISRAMLLLSHIDEALDNRGISY